MPYEKEEDERSENQNRLWRGGGMITNSMHSLEIPQYPLRYGDYRLWRGGDMITNPLKYRIISLDRARECDVIVLHKP